MAEEFADVSNWQGSNIDWGAYQRSGQQRAACKASEGVGYADPTFRRNWQAMKAAGLRRIAYHFGRPDFGNSPEAEADSHWAIVSGAGVDSSDMLVEDLEAGSGNLKAWAQRFLDRLAGRCAGIIPPEHLGLYSGNWFLVPHWITGFGPYWLWDSGYPNLPPVPSGWQSIDVHQYTSSASIPGIPGGVDCSRILNAGLFSGLEVDMQADERGALFAVKDLLDVVFARTDDTYNGVKYGITLDYGNGADRTGQPAGKVAAISLLEKLGSGGVDAAALAAAIVSQMGPGFAKAVVDEIGARVKPASP